jgi:hypothetical protein
MPPVKWGSSGGKFGKPCGNYCGRSFGDPHMATFDGYVYDFMAAGEFTLVRSRKDLEIQVRQQPYPGSKWVSVTTAAALRLAGDRVVVFADDPLQVRVNGRPVLVTAHGLRTPGGGRIRMLAPEATGLPAKLEATWPDGTFSQIWVMGDSGLVVLMSPAATRAGTLTGLLGNADGRKTNDVVIRGGPKIPLELSSHNTRGRAYRLFRRYADSWRVSQRTSLFDYAPRQSTRTFTDRRFPAPAPWFKIAAADKRRLAKAQRVCRRMKIKDSAVEADCVVDVLLTGDFDFAATTARLDRATPKKPKRKVKPPPPKPKPKPKPVTAQAAVRWAGKMYVYKKEKEQPFDGCSYDGKTKEFELQLSVPATTKNGFDYFKLIVQGATKDGTYTNGAAAVFVVNKNPIVIEQLQVKLAGNRTRGTLSGVDSTPAKQPVTGSFQC